MPQTHQGLQHDNPPTRHCGLSPLFFIQTFLLSRKLRKSAKIVYNGLEIKDHITKERM